MHAKELEISQRDSKELCAHIILMRALSCRKLVIVFFRFSSKYERKVTFIHPLKIAVNIA